MFSLFLGGLTCFPNVLIQAPHQISQRHPTIEWGVAQPPSMFLIPLGNPGLCLLPQLFNKKCILFHAYPFHDAMKFKILNSKIRISQEPKELKCEITKYFSHYKKCSFLDFKNISDIILKLHDPFSWIGFNCLNCHIGFNCCRATT